MKEPIWKSLAQAIETEPREYTKIRGATGLEHEVLQIAIDEKRKRLLVVSAEADPRAADATRYSNNHARHEGVGRATVVS